MADAHGPAGSGSTPGMMWIYCLCGWQSVPTDTAHYRWMEDMLAQYNVHIAESG